MLSPPPRSLSMPHRLAILAGGFSSQFGWLFFGFGMIFFWVFVMQSEARYWFLPGGDWQQSTGIVLEQAYASAEVNNQPVYRHRIRYAVAGADSMESVCYVDGTAFQAGARVPAEYPEKRPHEGRIAGSRRQMFPAVVSFVLIFPIVGLVFVVAGLRQNFKNTDLMIYGNMARGRFVEKTPTNTEINKQRVYRYTFEFNTPDGRTWRASGNTHQYHLLEDEESERILYHPNDPSFAVLFDLIPGLPEIGPDGGFMPRPRVYLSLLLPLASILLHGGIYWLFFKVAG